MNSMIWNNSFTFQWQMNVDYKILNVCFDCELKETVWLFASENNVFFSDATLCYVNDWSWEVKWIRYELKDFDRMLDCNY